VTQVGAAPAAAWTRDARRARLLAWASLAWMTIEGAVGILAGAAAGSIALVGFGLDSAIEGFASLIVIWRFTGTRTLSETSERRAQRAVAVSFMLLAPYVAFESVRDLVTGAEPETSWVGVALALSSIVLMPLLARAKHRLGERLDSAATSGEGTQNMLCAYLAGAVLVGLLGNALFGAAWLDPLAGLFIAGVAVNEGRELWQGDDCGCHQLVPAERAHRQQ
jgi:divalent metal cation (Fe/Co/Zn/Cd) transporter